MSKKPFFDYIGKLHELHTNLTFTMMRAYEIKGKIEVTDFNSKDIQEENRRRELTLNSALREDMRRLSSELEEFRQKLDKMSFEG